MNGVVKGRLYPSFLYPVTPIEGLSSPGAPRVSRRVAGGRGPRPRGRTPDTARRAGTAAGPCERFQFTLADETLSLVSATGTVASCRRSSCVDRRSLPRFSMIHIAHTRPGHRSKVHVTVHSLSDIVVTEDRSLARYRIARGPDIESPQRGPAPRYPRANPAKISRAMIARTRAAPARGAPETLGSGHPRTHRAIRRNAGGNAHAVRATVHAPRHRAPCTRRQCGAVNAATVCGCV